MTYTVRLILVFVVATLFSTTLAAQTQVTAIVPARPEEQARIKPLIEAETKAREALNAKIATLPEAKAVAAAKEAYDKALAALNAVTEKLPENDQWKRAGAAVLDAAYAIQAEHKLSSREYKPQLSNKGELEFTKLEAKP